MVAPTKKYYEQTDKTLPVYTIACLDYLFDPNMQIKVFAMHFRDDRGARRWASDMAKREGWYSWEVLAEGEREVYFVNQNTKEERVNGKVIPH